MIRINLQYLFALPSRLAVFDTLPTVTTKTADLAVDLATAQQLLIEIYNAQSLYQPHLRSSTTQPIGFSMS